MPPKIASKGVVTFAAIEVTTQTRPEPKLPPKKSVSRGTPSDGLKTRQPSYSYSMANQGKQLVDTKRVNGAPAVAYHGVWAAKTASMCEDWVGERVDHDEANISIASMSLMHALAYERKHRRRLPQDDLLLKGDGTKTPTDDDYREAEMRAFLNAVGEEDPEAVLASFKMAGTGGLHRQHVTVASTASTVIAGAALMVPEPITKTALGVTRMVLQAGIIERTHNSGVRRARNAGAEEMMVYGKADSTPSAKEGRSVMGASGSAIAHLHHIESDLARTRELRTGLQAAVARLHAPGGNTPAHRQAVIEAEKALHVQYAKSSHRAEIKADYKTASDSAKIEFFGSLRYLWASYSGSTAVLTASGLAIMLPALVHPAGPFIAGGLVAGAGIGALGAYVAYQLSEGASKDGEAKAKRAVEAWCKSTDSFIGNKPPGQKERAQAYKTYVQARADSRWLRGSASDWAIQRNEKKFMEALDIVSDLEKAASLPKTPHSDAFENYFKAVKDSQGLDRAGKQVFQERAEARLLTALTGLQAAGPASEATRARRQAYSSYHSALQATKSLPVSERAAHKERAESRFLATLAATPALSPTDPVEKFQKARTDAFEDFVRGRHAARHRTGTAKQAAREDADAELIAVSKRLLSQDEEASTGSVDRTLPAVRNWQASRDLDRALSATPDPAGKRDLLDEFALHNAKNFDTKALAGGWKGPMRIKMESAVRITNGSVAKTHRELMTVIKRQGATFKLRTDRSLATRRAELETQLEGELRDMFNLDLALRLMKPPKGQLEPSAAKLASAAAALAEVENPHVRHLFLGNAREQVEANNKAKELTAGEVERYTFANAGASAIGLVSGVALIGANIGISAQNAVDAKIRAHDPNHIGKFDDLKFNDQNFAGYSAAGAPLNSHQSAQERTYLQKKGLHKMRQTVAKPRSEPRISLGITLSNTETPLVAGNAEADGELRRLVAQLGTQKYVPEGIHMAAAPAADGKAGALHESSMTSTTAYDKVLYDRAPVPKKAAYNARALGLIGKQVGLTFVGLPVQGFAQIPMRRTREGLRETEESGPETREALYAAAQALDDRDHPRFPTTEKKVAGKRETPAADRRRMDIPLPPAVQGTVPRTAVQQGYARLSAAFPPNGLGVRTNNPALANVETEADLAIQRKAGALRDVTGGAAALIREQARLVALARQTLAAQNLTTGPASAAGANCLVDSILQQIGIPDDQRELEAAQIRIELRAAERVAGRTLGRAEYLLDSGPQFRNLIDIVNRRHPHADVAVHVVMPAANGDLIMLDQDASGSHPHPRANNVAIMWAENEHYEPIIARG